MHVSPHENLAQVEQRGSRNAKADTDGTPTTNPPTSRHLDKGLILISGFFSSIRPIAFATIDILVTVLV